MNWECGGLVTPRTEPESAKFLQAPGQCSVLQVLGRAWCFILQLSLLARGVGSAGAEGRDGGRKLVLPGITGRTK